MESAKIGISIITGFLGAGKTSLLNQILKKESGYKFAIIENEFSETSIDAEIIEGIERTKIFELSNGCICCTTNTEFQETVIQLIQSEFEFDHILIETTGIAEPGSIVQSVIANAYLKEMVYIDGIICIVDASNYQENSNNFDVIRQIALADILLINKYDKLSVAKLDQIKENLLQINPLATRIITSFSDYDTAKIIDNQSFNIEIFEDAFRKELTSRTHFLPDFPVKSISIQIDGDFDKNKFMYWIEYFLLLNQSKIYRSKGILSFSGNSRKQIFQAVKASFSVEDGSFWQYNENKCCKLIFIGKDLNKDDIRQSLLTLMPEV